MQEKQDKSNESIPEDVFSDKILSFMNSKELGAIRLTNKRLNFLSKDQYQLNRLLTYINKGKFASAWMVLRGSPKVLEHDEYPERFIHSCLKEGNVKKINFLLDHRPEFVLNKKYEPLIGCYLLKYGVKANQKAAELLIKKNPNLLLFKGDVVDDSGRYFKNVSFLQAITWCLDVLYMGKMVYQSLPKNEKGEKIRIQLSEQLEEVSKGLSFELKIGDYLPKTEEGQKRKKQLIAGIKKLIELKYLDYEFKEGADDILIIKNEPHFDLRPLVKALLDYTDSRTSSSNYQCLEFWCTVIGLLQTLLPLYIRQHLCNPDAAFDPMPSFKEKEFKRCLDFDNWINPAEKLLDCSAFGLGLDYGVYRGSHDLAVGLWPPGREWNPTDDLFALLKLCEITEKGLVSLIELLKQPLIQLEHTSKLGF